MTKRKKLAKQALNSPEKFSYGELAYFQKWLDEHKHAKALRKKAAKDSKFFDNTGGDEGAPDL
jgi:hypothetical protein